jgi:tetratricopeptide (TPR) repeat protein
MRSQRIGDRAKQLEAFVRELSRRKVLRTLAIYCAIAWGAIAAAPDLLSYLALPTWTFTALVVTLIVGLPLVVVASWHLEILVDNARTPDSSSSVASPQGPTPEVASAPDADVVVAAEAPPRRLRWRHLAVGAAALYLLVVGARWLMPGGRAEPLPRLIVFDAVPGAVIGASGTTPAGELLRQSLGWLLPAEVLARPHPGDPSLRAYQQEARVAGADYYVTVDVAQASDGATISVTTRSISSGEVVFQATGGGEAESIAGATGRIAVQLAQRMASIEGLDLRLRPEVAGATSSPGALGHYLEGSRLFAEVQFDQAADAFGRAIRTDSGFVPAYYRAAVVERWRWDHEAGLALIDAALRRPGLPPRWARLLEAQRAYLLRDTERTIALYADVTLHYPELLDGWVELGEALFHYGGFVGHDPSEARTALATAMEMDSLIAPVEHHLAELALLHGDLEAADLYIERMASAHPLRPVVRTARALRFGSDAERRESLTSLRRMDLRTLSLLVAHFSFDQSGRAWISTIAEELLSDGRTPEDRLRGAQYLLVAAASDEEWSAALTRWRALGAATSFDPWVVHAHLAGRATPEAERMIRWARAEVAGGRLPDFGTALNHDSRGVFQAVVHDAVLHGDSADVGELLDRLRAATVPQRTDPSRDILAAALRSRLALLASDTTLAIQELGAALSRTLEPVVTFYPLGTMAPERLLLVRLARATGRTPLAERWRHSFFRSMSFGDLVYQAWVPDVDPFETAVHPPTH